MGTAKSLERATALHRVVVTHDLAFGKVEIRGGASFVGIVYLRPGHISAAFVLAVIDALRESSIDVQPAEHLGERRTAITAEASKSWHSLGLVARSLLPLRSQCVEDWRMEVLGTSEGKFSPKPLVGAAQSKIPAK